MIKSLKNQLVIALGILVTVIGVIQGVSSYKLSQAGTNALLDTRLVQVATRMRDGFAEGIPANPSRGSQDDRDVVVVVWKPGEAVPFRTTEPSLRFPRDAAPGFSNVVANSEHWRIYTRREPTMTIQVAQRASVRHDLTEETATLALWPTVVLLPLVWILVALVVRRSLRQLTELGREVQGIDTSHLQPLSLVGVPTEIKPFIESINTMIERLAGAIDKERKFIADAAHELRTPLTALQLQADNLAPHIAPGNQERFQELRKGIARSGKLIAQLLRLARADAPVNGAAPLARVDLSEVVTGAVADVLPIAIARGLDIGAEEMVSAHVRAIETDLGMAVKNLVSNAVRYTPDGGTIDLRMRRDGERVWIDVIDTGPGIDEALLPRVFDRFFRACPDIEGSGLGLSIVKAIAARYGGDVMLRNRDDGQSGIVASIGFVTEAVTENLTAPDPVCA
ncbi:MULTISPECIES: ATP-binding protein [unclassified Caballeronia]|uniref:ATP-binding protein n=1 Tax=unclassified Caballeronia TaxID=2646786 RepID=UPI00285F196D|nr:MULTISPECIES: ATP-binding protein [unclassified Caballeronia]MDR5817515.1 ATP-binding protein [Caballeronia sp. LZ033]MDR5824460.1 ATP-binding protein [Caballeronia sp. LZ043]MDR5882352.1 ATP-binding protein [Caballeronia sp. LZ032]